MTGGVTTGGVVVVVVVVVVDVGGGAVVVVVVDVGGGAVVVVVDVVVGGVVVVVVDVVVGGAVVVVTPGVVVVLPGRVVVLEDVPPPGRVVVLDDEGVGPGAVVVVGRSGTEGRKPPRIERRVVVGAVEPGVVPRSFPGAPATVVVVAPGSVGAGWVLGTPNPRVVVLRTTCWSSTRVGGSSPPKARSEPTVANTAAAAMPAAVRA